MRRTEEKETPPVTMPAPAAPSVPAPPTRRERVRAATMEEIKGAALDLLRSRSATDLTFAVWWRLRVIFLIVWLNRHLPVVKRIPVS